MTPRAVGWAAAAICAVALLAPSAHAAPELEWRGQVTTDVRVLTNDDVDFERSETTAQAHLSARLDRHIAAVGHVRLMYTEASDPQTFEGLVDRSVIDPFRLESDALFVDFIDIGPDDWGVDLRVGRQQLIWGSADRFHPVSNLNPLDVEDPIVFGEVIANEMVTLSIRPNVSAGGDEDEGVEPWFDELSLQLVFVPFFKPAQVPASGKLGFTDKRVFTERANTPLTRELAAQQDYLEGVGWTFDYGTRVELPDRSLDNSMFGARLGMRLAGVDLGLSYFNGFDDFPRAEKIVADTTAAPHVGAEITLSFPRVQVLGFDFATSLGFLDGLGLWGELGVTLHEDMYRIVSTGPMIGINDIEIEHDAGAFIKAVAGIDYSVTPWLYLNVQYLHGFVDEFGSRELEDYIVAGGDIKLDGDRWLIRFFNIFNLQDGSYTLYPQLSVKPWQSGELVLGAFIYSSAFGGFDETKKFESRAVGSSTVFLQARAFL